MGFFRFRRSFRIGPGLRINVSKSGVSESIGRRGAWLTFGPGGTRSTVGIPGSGLSYTQQSRGGGGVFGLLVLIALVVGAVLMFM